MTTQEVRRKLTAILSADVKGYSRLLGEDELGTIRTLNAHKEVMGNLIQRHRGRVVDAPGDNLLADFGSVVDAVQCAVEIQTDLKIKNAELQENRRMEFRIGVNLGDVVEEEGKIYGDGVNIAARLESLSEAGGVCISGIAFDQVRNKLKLGYEFQGEQTVKNIAEPVRVYKVLMEPETAGKVTGEKSVKAKQWQMAAIGLVAAVIVIVATVAIWRPYLRPTSPHVEVASKEKMALPLPDVPSVAVLPFANMSDDPKQEYLADGLAEEIINGLSKCPHIFVIARNSSFTYKGRPVKVQQVAEELGVRYVLEGSLRKTGDRVRIAVQLIDALTGQHLFSERFDRELKEILDMQDEITMKILAAIQVKLTQGEDARLRAKGTTNLEAYLTLMQARQYMQVFNKENYALARRLTEQAIALDPRYAAAYATLCRIQTNEVVLGIYKNPRDALEQAAQLGEKAIALDDSDTLAHAMVGMAYVWLRQYDKAIAEAKKAVSLDPNSAYAYQTLGSVLNYASEPEEAIPFFKKSLRLSPIAIDPATLINMGMAYRNTGQYEEAVDTFKKAIRVYGPDHLFAHFGLATTYALMGREKEAHAEAGEVMRIDPGFSVESFSKRLPQKDQKAIEFHKMVARKAGLK